MMFLLKQTDCWINDDGDNGATNDTDLLYPRWTQRKMNSPKKKRKHLKNKHQICQRCGKTAEEFKKS